MDLALSPIKALKRILYIVYSHLQI